MTSLTPNAYLALGLLALTSLTSCATTSRDATVSVAPYFANREAAQPIAASEWPATTAAKSEPTFAPGHFARKSAFSEARSDGQPRGMAFVRGAAGTETVEVRSGTDITSDTDAGMLEVGFEGTGRVMGGGLRFSARATDDDLLEGSNAVDTQGEGANFFAHLTIRPGGGKFRMPIRIGPEVRANAFLLDASPFGSIAELDFVSVGGAIEVEPEVDFFRNDNAALSIYGRAHVGAGVAQISSDTTDYDTEAVNVGLEIGLRLQLKKFLLSGGYLAQSDEYAESDPENFSFVEETTWQFEGLFLMLGVRW